MNIYLSKSVANMRGGKRMTKNRLPVSSSSICTSRAKNTSPIAQIRFMSQGEVE